MVELIDVLRCAVGQLSFTVSPDMLIGVELWRVGRKPMHVQPMAILPQVVLHESTAVDRPAVPNYHDRSAQVAQQHPEELYDLHAGDVLSVKTRIQSDSTL